MKLEKLLELCNDATPGPWLYDGGNWEVEGPRPDRYTICLMTPDARATGFPDQTPNPVDSGADGELIAAARNLLPKFIRLAAMVDEFAKFNSHQAWHSVMDARKALEAE